MKWTKWKLGFVIACFCGFLNAGASLVDGMHWKAFVAVLCTSLLTNLLTYLKDHPVEAIEPDNSNAAKVGLIALLCFSPIAFNGCGTPQVAAYKAEGVVITTADSAMKAYADYTQTHPPTQAQYDLVHKSWDTYYNAQQVAKIALEAYVADANEGTAAALESAENNAENAAQAVINLVKGLLK